jgi:hypothetical protein
MPWEIIKILVSKQRARSDPSLNMHGAIVAWLTSLPGKRDDVYLSRVEVVDRLRTLDGHTV